MKRSHLFGVCSLVLMGLLVAHSQTPQSRPRAFKLTTAQQQEYVKLVKSNSGKAAVRAWARKHKLEIISLKGYNITVIPEQEPQYPTDQELRAAACDPKTCPTLVGSSMVLDAGGTFLGVQQMNCTAKQCKLIWIEIGGKRVQVKHCTDYKCADAGAIQ
jgi:hypothetical protein